MTFIGSPVIYYFILD